MTNLGFIGYGRVGEATANIFARNQNIFWYDKYRSGGKSLTDVVSGSDILFVGLPTPADFNGLCIDLTIMDENMEHIAESAKKKDSKLGVVIKSTVVPGTTRDYQEQYPHLKMAMSPEFLTDDNYIDDALNPDRVVFGSDDKEFLKELMYLYRNRFPEVPIFRMNPTEAEFVKYAANISLAMNITMGNLFHDVAGAVSEQGQVVNWNENVMPAVVADARVGKHMKVSSDRGFGGKCFPKDLLAFIGLINRYNDGSLDYAENLFKSMWDYNLSVRKVHDWEEIPGAVAGKAHELYSG